MNEYSIRGDYHKNLDPNWSYYPIYIRKVAFVEKYLSHDIEILNKKILDVGCGEGVMVEKFKEKGYKILGVDKYYKSKSILQADILTLPFEDNSFDYILFLDVIEHLFYPEQLIAVKELKRVLKPGGKIILSVPNLAHLASRISFFFKGKLSRTANIHKHPGDRPAEEYIQIFNEISLNVEKRIGIELSLGSLFKKYLKKLISKVLYEKLFFASIYNPNLCFLNIFILNNSKK